MSIAEHQTTGGDRVAFVVHDGVVNALDAASASLGVTRSHFIRSRIVEYLKSEGWLQPEAPSSRYEAKRKANNA